MQIEGKNPFLSITPFEALDVPQLLIVVGPNGSGKTHLLRAIEQGAVATDAAQAPTRPQSQAQPSEILRLENSAQGLLRHTQSSGLVQPDARSPKTSPRQTQRQSDPLLDGAFSQIRTQLLENPLGRLKSELGQKFSGLNVPENDVWTLDPQAILDQMGPFSVESTARIHKIFDDANDALTKAYGGNAPIEDEKSAFDPINATHITSAIKKVSDRLGISPTMVTKAQVMNLRSWGTLHAFDPNIAQFFSSYRDDLVRNDWQAIKDKREGTKLAVSDDQFRGLYGPPPWDTISELISTFGLNYRVAAPSLEPTEPCSFQLERLDGRATVQFDALSSGEKVLLQLALSLLQIDPIRLKIVRPRLLLLDEMDASLHPEMLHRWLSAIREIIVREHGIPCILTTHSPVTVALAPDSSLYELDSNPTKLNKVTKQQALNRLTIGLPSLSIDFSGRRQILVESDTDADNYEKINAIIKAEIKLPRTITFLSTGLRNGKDEVGTGCAVVRKMVGALEEHGNTSVFGIIDWDGSNEPSGRVRVIGSGSHYALDNLLLDPLLVGAILLRDTVSMPGISMTFSGLESASKEELQALADTIQNALTYPSGAPAGTSTSRYLGGLALQIRSAFCLSRGHDMEEALVAAFPALKRYSAGGRGKLLSAIVERVLSDFPQFCPEPIARIFQEIAGEDL